MEQVWLVFDNYEYYNAEDRIAYDNMLKGVFSSHEKAIKYAKEELIARLGKTILHGNLDVCDSVDVEILGSELMHRIYIAHRPVW